jgi:lycopene beta-cyclase
MKQPHYDIIMAGGGAASRIVLYFLQQQSSFAEQKILLIEGENKISEKTWCFWNKNNHPFEHLIAHSWDALEFRSENFSKTECITPYRYSCIKGRDFDAFFNEDFFPQHPNVSVLTGTITSTTQTAGKWTVHTTDATYTCDLLFSNMAEPLKDNTLYQHFQGWFIEYDAPVFDPGKAVLMDFTAQHKTDFCFFYVLPFSGTKALVECTFYSSRIFNSAIYQSEIETYLQKHYGNAFRIVSKEQGAIPLHSNAFPAPSQDNLIKIGQSAGMIKPSTGYAFQRMVEDAALIAASLHAEQQQRRSRPARFLFYDRLLLHIIREEPLRATHIFQQLFCKSRIQDILTFLDENSGLADEVKIFSGLPWWPFLKRIKLLS